MGLAVGKAAYELGRRLARKAVLVDVCRMDDEVEVCPLEDLLAPG
jgi:hypothetical protein